MSNKPTILYICIDSTLGGSTASLYNLIESIRNKINPIVLFSEEGEGVDFFRRHEIESHIYPFISLHRFCGKRIWETFLHPWRWHYIYKIRTDKKCCEYVKKILNGRHVDIVHSNTSPNDIGVKLAKTLKAKHVWHVREFCDLHFHFEIYGGLPRLQRLINKADARIAISNAIKQHWQMPDENTWIINDAIRSKNEVNHVKEKEKYVLFCSYFLTEPKGTRIAIEAFANSGIAGDGYKLLLIGNCSKEYKQSLIIKINELGVADSVVFVPCQTDIKPYFSKATAYIMASDCEGLGRVTAEAMFFGCPVIARATGGTLDIVKDGETGYLFNTIDECARLIRKVCNEDNEPLILRAQKFAIENLSQEVYGPKIMEVYNYEME